MTPKRYLSLWLPHLAVDRLAHRGLDGREAGVGKTGVGKMGAGKTDGRPVAVVLPEAGRLTILAVNPAAGENGVAPGMSLSDGRALCPGLAAADADLPGDRAALERLVRWCGRYTPWAAADPAAGPAEGGVLLDVTGCAHLLGGEAELAADLRARLSDFGLTVRLGLAGAVGGAWALARFGPAAVTIQPPGALHEALAGLPVAGLRLPAADVETLARLGLRRIGDLYGMPRAALAVRFGDGIRRRLDQALGHEAEAISPRRPRQPLAVRRSFAEPLLQPEAVALTLDALLVEMCQRLEADGLGVRRLTYTLCRADGSGAEASIGVSRPSRDPRHLARLFAPRLETLDPEPGIDTLILTAATAEPAAPQQEDLRQEGLRPERVQPEGARTEALRPGPAPARAQQDTAAPPDLAALVDRLANRLGAAQVTWQAPVETPLPERQTIRLPALAAPPPDWSAWRAPHTAASHDAARPPAARPHTPRQPFGGPLPVRLLDQPEVLDPIGACPQGPARPPARPPARFLWRGRLWRICPSGAPEPHAPPAAPPAAPPPTLPVRVLGPWWRDDHTARDYQPAEAHCLDTGTDPDPDPERAITPRLWLFHDLTTRRWHVHGVFG